MSLFNYFTSPNPTTYPYQGRQRQRVFPAHVLEVCLDEDSSLYENPVDIGKIKYRDLGNINVFQAPLEETTFTVAWPLDRTNIRYPLPGEQVIIFEAMGDVLLPSADVVQRIAYYTFNVNTTHNVTYNSVPFLLSNPDTISKSRVSEAVARIRFENKLTDKDKFKLGSDPKTYPQLKPYEGDFIIQGRFGNSIRLGSTSTAAKEKQDTTTGGWSDNRSGVATAAGDPIIVMRVNKAPITNTETQPMYIDENLKEDQGSIYMCSSQNVEVNLAFPKHMRSWEATYEIQGSDTLGKIETTSKLYEEVYAKVADMSKAIAPQVSPAAHADPNQTTTTQNQATNQTPTDPNQTTTQTPVDPNSTGGGEVVTPGGGGDSVAQEYVSDSDEGEL